MLDYKCSLDLSFTSKSRCLALPSDVELYGHGFIAFSARNVREQDKSRVIYIVGAAPS